HQALRQLFVDSPRLRPQPFPISGVRLQHPPDPLGKRTGFDDLVDQREVVDLVATSAGFGDREEGTKAVAHARAAVVVAGEVSIDVWCEDSPPAPPSDALLEVLQQHSAGWQPEPPGRQPTGEVAEEGAHEDGDGDVE